ncbi:MAG: hypothetical protein BalsKO_09690 [Balneolaceae bacterium]
MKIQEIIGTFSKSISSLPVKCFVKEIEAELSIELVGQVQPNHPGVVLGDEPLFEFEKTVCMLVEELNTFGNRFDSNNFLMQFHSEINEKEYELHYFKLDRIELVSSKVLLISESEEMIELKERLEYPEYE